MVNIKDRLKGCLVGGAIGDSVGSYYEGQKDIAFVDFDIFNGITDDTQLTIATCESIIQAKRVSPESISKTFLEWFNKRMLTGLGSSTLKALRDLQAGAHWGLSGRSGEYAAGNGAAMRIAPLAFLLNISEERMLIRDICNITHKNDEAYVGCLSILYALDSIITNQWKYGQNLIDLVVPFIPDTSVKDNLLTLQENPSISILDAARLIGCSGHVIESVPLSIFATQKIKENNFEEVLSAIIQCGGDTDTNAALAGQLMGALIGYSGISATTISTFSKIRESSYILNVADELSILIEQKQT